MKNNVKDQFREGILPQRTIFTKTAIICAIAMIPVPIAVAIVLAITVKFYLSFAIAGVLLVLYVAIFLVWNAKISAVEQKIQTDKFRAMVDGIVDLEEYDLPVMDCDYTVKVTKTGFDIDGEIIGFDSFDIFMGTTNMCRQASVAFFVVSNYSPFSDEKTYPINFGIKCDSLSLGCAKKYFYDSEYKAFKYLIENPEESAKEILRYGLLKVQIEEQKKMKQLEKLERELDLE